MQLQQGGCTSHLSGTVGSAVCSTPRRWIILVSRLTAIFLALCAWTTAPLATEPDSRRPGAPPGSHDCSSNHSMDSTAMELFMAQLVTHYEAGDVDQFFALFDVSSFGFWSALSVRHTFEDFFRSTRTRRLRLRGISWTLSGCTGRAVGTADLDVSWFGEPVKTERIVAIEVGVVDRHRGQPRISRLSIPPLNTAVGRPL